MSKRQIWILATAIAGLMVVLVIIQARWITVASRAKQAQLLQQVGEILTNVSEKAGHRETISKTVGSYSLNRGNRYLQSGTRQTKDIYTNSGMRLLEKNLDIFSIPSIDSLRLAKSLESIVGDSLNRLIFNRSLDGSLISRISNELNLNDGPTQDVYVESITEKIISIDLPIEKRTSIQELDSLVQEELKNRNLDASYKLAVTNENSEYVMLEDGFLINSPESTYVEQLFPYDSESAKKYYIHLYIPHQNVVILRSMGVMFVSSIVLILTIVGLFVIMFTIIFKQKRLAQIRSDFVSNMTHELKTPIATISLAAQMLEDKNIPNELKNVDHLSKMVREESKRLGGLVEKVLQMAIFDRGNFKLKRKQLDLHSIIRKTLENYSLQFESKSVKVTYEFDANQSLVYGDEVHITNIISNLIDNAIKYSKDSPTINITTLNKNDGIIVSVKDNGIGISKEYQKRIFEQFFRVPTGNVHSVKGFGLGLSYVKRIAEMHDGSIWLQSEQGTGSTFSIYLPLMDLNIDNTTKN